MTSTAVSPERLPARRATMKALAVLPGSVRLRDVLLPRVEDVPNGRGELVRVLRVGVDGTGREINGT